LDYGRRRRGTKKNDSDTPIRSLEEEIWVIMGRLGLRYDDLFYITIPELMLMAEGAEQRDRTVWEAARWQAAVLLSPHLKKGKQIRPQQLIKFPWEKGGTKRKIATADRLERAQRLFDILEKQKNGSSFKR
jgi:hypothetical protein